MKTTAWSQKAAGEPLAKVEIEITPGPGDAIVEVAGCGLCHTDLGFLDGEVNPRGPRPLVAGHEIAGTVVWAPAAFKSLEGRQVIVPAVWPCGSCGPCFAGQPTACLSQRMPGNDTAGGFAHHVAAPVAHLAPLAEPTERERLAEMAVIADAIATPFEAATRADVRKGDLCIVIGAGGLGGFLVQIAALRGARVIALDVDPHRLALVREYGANAVCVPEEKSMRDRVRALAHDLGAPSWGWKIFETSGSTAGQQLAWQLVGPAATLAVVGYQRERISVRLSNLMAFDARAFGVWGCRPALYPEVVELVRRGRIELGPFVERHPLESINDVLAAARAHQLRRRAVLVPSAGGIV
jgi:6-hydroxycyclohex-1-ene-1-carbonyl-CoA dehydrogenase